MRLCLCRVPQASAFLFALLELQSLVLVFAPRKEGARSPRPPEAEVPQSSTPKTTFEKDCVEKNDHAGFVEPLKPLEGRAGQGKRMARAPQKT